MRSKQKKWSKKTQKLIKVTQNLQKTIESQRRTISRLKSKLSKPNEADPPSPTSNFKNMVENSGLPKETQKQVVWFILLDETEIFSVILSV